MGQKVNPISFRLGNLFTWGSRWYADKNTYKKYLFEDKKIRDFLDPKLRTAGLVKIEIERSLNAIKVKLFVSRPGVVIGRGGANLDLLKQDLAKALKVNLNDPKGMKLVIDDIVEVKDPDLSARLVAERITDQLAKRFPHRTAVNQAIQRSMDAGAKGIKIVLAGRIGGAEISRREKYSKGTVPTQTLRGNIDYFELPSKTKSGYVGVKVWIYRGQEAMR
ncbi:MAG TPA: 30S ribosomal protein S3 [Candidatus Pacebacteria bacterium]|uniref:30S ribosomal protein S3 n=1 Tax=uncultured organism TaxID=155900 RepID=U3GSM1_9ZZZZ|nr:30S ribosomal protein S3 [uncultured organism]KKT97904.1 MAG: 30S ribosomal protein S3 [Microgenomates group bacterium GW2011_GWB1_45_17]KKU23660.1 MAG: 30S ribosomal protein S3 [Microgenomates group bacterium GW2011_GWA1_46_15]KKU24561.1 MAG: 30S ribosomal protein S3 [Microgenomates group bacterium GW2011_GWC1_46_15]OGJ21764.1 MAG: 30S ribosomal protein S3 [Candidatus Pacebacteria bacterium RIFCSPHIGHO2_01_FULL_46_10]HAV15295.1 30S ribosomal protein S3 [Candidatus Paceibacterota bacterium]